MLLPRADGNHQSAISRSLRNKPTNPASALPRYTGFYSPPLDAFPVAPSGAFPQTHPNTGGNERGYDDRVKSPYTVNMNVTVGRELPGGLLFQASYVGRISRRSLIGTDMMNPTNLVDTRSGMDYFQAAQLLGH